MEIVRAAFDPRKGAKRGIENESVTCERERGLVVVAAAAVVVCSLARSLPPPLRRHRTAACLPLPSPRCRLITHIIIESKSNHQTNSKKQVAVAQQAAKEIAGYQKAPLNITITGRKLSGLPLNATGRRLSGLPMNMT